MPAKAGILFYRCSSFTDYEVFCIYIQDYVGLSVKIFVFTIGFSGKCDIILFNIAKVVADVAIK
ncbi:MAG: hypothetical protein H6Q74_570 [Firmicutes bacterium]|nr:hypothetical protein [Bacillota bacterium]